MLALLPHPARAVPYEVFIDIETEEDLYDLLVTEQVSEASFDALLLLHQTRIDVNRAGREELYLLPNLEYDDVDRILSYREDAGSIHQLGDLIASEALTRRLAESLVAFTVVRPAEAAHKGADGFLRLQSRWSGRHDRLPPAAALQARVHAASHLDAGIMASLTRNSLRRVRWDVSRQALSVQSERPRLEFPKAYVEWDTETWEIVVGTYRIGFGQRLTFDVTDQVTPNGAFGDYELRRVNELGLRCKRSAGELESSPCPKSPVVRVTPDFMWTNRLTGLAAGLKQVPLGRGKLQAYAWGSLQPHRARSIELVEASRCADPRNDEAPGCGSPEVYVRGRDPSAPASTASYASLPLVAAEGVAGAHLGYAWDSRSRFGLTGYGSATRWLINGARLDYQEFASKPFGGPFGAVGLSASYGFRRQDLFAEVARSFDRQPGGGGGYGGVARSVTSFVKGELDLSVRYYDSRFANPYARPVSAPDQLDGLRARDEAGLRMRIAQRAGARASFRVLLDGWRQLSKGAFQALSFARADVDLAPTWAWSVWTEYRTPGRGALVASRLAFEPIRQFAMSCQLQHRWLRATTTRAQRDLAVVLHATTRPVDILRVRARLRYDVEDIDDNHRLPHTIWLYVDSAIAVRKRDVLRVRYDLRAFLDERKSTLIRVPNPEHWLWLEYVLHY
jgi:hypothetical protein